MGSSFKQRGTRYFSSQKKYRGHCKFLLIIFQNISYQYLLNQKIKKFKKNFVDFDITIQELLNRYKGDSIWTNSYQEWVKSKLELTDK